MEVLHRLPSAFNYPQNGGNVHNFYNQSAVLSYIETFSLLYGGLFFKQTAKSYCKGVWVICAKPLLNFLDRIHTKPVF